MRAAADAFINEANQFSFIIQAADVINFAIGLRRQQLLITQTHTPSWACDPPTHLAPAVRSAAKYLLFARVRHYTLDPFRPLRPLPSSVSIISRTAASHSFNFPAWAQQDIALIHDFLITTLN